MKFKSQFLITKMNKREWFCFAVAAGAPILFFFAILLIPETPSFLLYHGREEEACKSLAWLRSSDEDVASEMETLRSNILTKHKSFFPRCSSQFPFRQLFITCGLMFFQKFPGVTVFFHYAVPIFKQVSLPIKTTIRTFLSFLLLLYIFEYNFMIWKVYFMHEILFLFKLLDLWERHLRGNYGNYYLRSYICDGLQFRKRKLIIL